MTHFQPNKSWEITVEEDPKTGNLILPLPEDFLQQTGWKEGDEVEWKENSDGSWLLSKINNE